MGDRVAIIFGGAGFIGRHLTEALIGSGDYRQIVVCDRHPPKERLDGVDHRIADVTKPITLKNIPAGAEIYNLAAVHTTPGHEDWEYFWTNIWGAIHICAFATLVNARMIFFSSSISTYGPTEEPRNETGPMLPESAYGRSKLMAEAIQRLWQAAVPGRLLRIVRPAVVFGRGEGGNFTRLAATLKRGFFFFPGRDDAVKSNIYVGELVRSMLFVRDLSDGEVTYNAAYPARYTTKDICAAFCKEGGYRMPGLVVPLWFMLVGGLAFEILGTFGIKTSINRARLRKLVDSTNIVPKRLLELGYAFETDLPKGLAAWHSQLPGGDFV